MLRVGIKLRLDFNQLPLKKQKRSFHVLLIYKNTSYCHVRRRICTKILGKRCKEHQ